MRTVMGSQFWKEEGQVSCFCPDFWKELSLRLYIWVALPEEMEMVVWYLEDGRSAFPLHCLALRSSPTMHLGDLKHCAWENVTCSWKLPAFCQESSGCWEGGPMVETQVRKAQKMSHWSWGHNMRANLPEQSLTVFDLETGSHHHLGIHQFWM